MLRRHTRFDLTEKIEFVDEMIRGHGGYSDVYYGRFINTVKYVAIKRLRVHIHKEHQLSKASNNKPNVLKIINLLCRISLVNCQYGL